MHYTNSVCWTISVNRVSNPCYSNIYGWSNFKNSMESHIVWTFLNLGTLEACSLFEFCGKRNLILDEKLPLKIVA